MLFAYSPIQTAWSACFSTGGISDDGGSDSVQTIDPLWNTENLVTLITDGTTEKNPLLLTAGMGHSRKPVLGLSLEGIWLRRRYSYAYVNVVMIDSAGETN